MTSPFNFAYGESDHPVFEQADPTALVWRHLSVPDLLALLGTRKLHFSRLDSFDDPFEGTLPKAHAEEWQAMGVKSMEVFNYSRTHYAACCWYLSEHESDAMWRLYARDGVAIQSTFGRLISSFPAHKPVNEAREQIYVGKITYFDYAGAPPNSFNNGGQHMWINGYQQMMHKRLSFAHENEVRAIFGAMGTKEITLKDGNTVMESRIPPGGAQVPIDVETLIQEVYVSPTRPSWFRDVVQDAIGRYDLKRDVRHSALAMTPYGMP